ncbi:uncharacterized protein UHOD_00860 [Ustilago sp. UG-2017b]|nr:uncharacterized protein UHOD_00860 [Ustilago sp. UG-2017b]
MVNPLVRNITPRYVARAQDATLIVPSMPNADASPTGSAHTSVPTTAHTAIPASEFEGWHTPAWV